jgi:hypothetical protein
MPAAGPKIFSATDTLANRLGWIGLVGGLLLQAIGYLSAFITTYEIPAWIVALGVTSVLTGTLILGATRKGRLSAPARLAAGAMFAILTVCFVAAAALPVETHNEPFWLGLPRRAAIVLLGVGVLPMLVLTLAYASDHRDDDLDEAALQRLRTECARLRGEAVE